MFSLARAYLLLSAFCAYEASGCRRAVSGTMFTRFWCAMLTKTQMLTHHHLQTLKVAVPAALEFKMTDTKR